MKLREKDKETGIRCRANGQRKTTKTMRKILFMTVIMTSMILASCNVTRTITTQSQYFQHGDTTCTIVTKTIETYDAKKNL